MSKHIRHMVAALMALLIAVSFFPPRSTSAETLMPALSEQDAIAILQTYSIVRGDENGNLGLDQRLTRAQAAAIFVRVLGSESMAKLLANSVPFSDGVGHWAAGEMALADRLNLMHGDGNGTFRPNADITYAEVLTVLLRIVGREPQGPWDRGVIMTEAARYGLVPTGALATAPAIRSKIFWSLAVAASSLQLPTGETALQKYFDRIPPTLTVDKTSMTTDQATIAITGTAKEAAYVTVESDRANLDRSTGSFTYTAKLQTGANSFTVNALDFAGNLSSADVIVTRIGSVARIDVSGPAMIKSNSSTKLTVKALDSQGREVPGAALQSQVTGGVAAYNVATSTLTAGDKTGHGVLTLSVGGVRANFAFDVTDKAEDAVSLSIATINNGRAATPGTDVTVRVSVIGSDGKVATEDYWRTVSLTSSGLSGLSIADSTVTTQAGVATFTVKSSRVGEATLTASSTGLTSDTAFVQFLTGTRVVLTSTTSTMVPDGTTTATIRASLQDEKGSTLNNSTGADIQINLSTADTDGELTDSVITIRRGNSTSSGDDGEYRVGLKAGTTLIQGEVVSAQNYPVQTLALAVTGSLSGAKLQLIVPSTNQAPGTGTAPITVKVLDAQNRLVTSGSYAFQITLSTSNKDPLTGGIPDGVEFGFTNSEYYPVDDGRSASNSTNDAYSVVGRTYQGTASLFLKYSKSGVVTLTPKLVSSSTDAYNPTSGFGPAVGSTTLTTDSAQVTFAGTPTKIQLTVDSNMGKDLPAGAISVSSTVMTIRARAVDSSGAPVPGYSGTVTLTRGTTGDHVTKLSDTTADSLRKTMTNGVSEWKVQGTGTAGYDVYTATASTLSSATVTVAVRSAAVDPPTIAAIRGSTDGNPSPDVGLIAPDADYMDIQLTPPAFVDEGSTYWVTAKVYRKGESSPIYMGAIDLMQEPPIIHVPKSALNKSGKYRYEVSLHNGVKDSSRSPDPGFDLDQAVNAEYSTTYKLTGGLFDAQTGKLVLTGSGLASNGIVVPTKIALEKDDHRIELGTFDLTVVSISSTQIVLQSDSLIDALDPETYHGAVTIDAKDGWYTSSDGSLVALATSTPVVKPLGVINYGTLDDATRTLYLYGEGLSLGTFNASFVQIGTVKLRQGSTSSYDVVTPTSDTQITIKLSQTSFDAIRALSEDQAVITADMGWLKVTSGGGTFMAPAIEGATHGLYVRVSVTGASYDRSKNTLTIRGSGFLGATVDSQKLLFRATSTKTNHALDSSAVVTVVDNGSITVELGTADTTFFESTSGLSGKNVFMNTSAGWLTNSSGRLAAPIPTDLVYFRVSSQ